MTAALKTVIVDALKGSSLHEISHLDRLPYNVEVVQLEGIENQTLMIQSDDNAIREWGCAFDADRLATAIRDHFLDREKVRAALIDVVHNADESMVDRLIEGLAGGSEG